MREEENKTVNKYNMLLMGPTVDIVHPLWECLVSVEIIINNNNIKKEILND
ncbi:hypothetical protein Glove_476g81 [Diversispora epigaea]|uniref:Uncharacterized protein n=1 Tax=Diversispora epigaea TaxID=1348612 RepID=A0A397GPI9_9GLOM|nr:hypothetical protein Glove_476g81 [Diversispora epigaea]